MADFIGGLHENAKEAQREADARKEMPDRVASRRHMQAVEYRVDIVRSKILGDRVDHHEVALVLNDRAADGWTLRAAVETEVEAQGGRGGTKGVMLMLERPGPAARD